MENQLVYNEFLNHLGRMLLFRCDSFQETSDISEVMTTDPQGYLTVNVPFVQEFFQEEFAEIVSECVEKETLPARKQLLERFQFRPILSEKNPIERYYRNQYSRRRARKQQHAFLLAVAECFPVCIKAVPSRIPAQVLESTKVSAPQAQSPFLSAREVAQKLEVSDKTVRSWARQGKIRAKFKADRKGKKRLVGIPQDAVAELVRERKPSELAKTA